MPVPTMNEAQNRVASPERTKRNGHPGCVVWITGLSGSGKSTISTALERRLFAAGNQVYVLDGDVLRGGLNQDLGFSPEARKENIRRAAHVAALLADAGLICIAAFISPYRSDRDLARSLVPPGRFLEVHLDVPVSVCERRDPKGLYAKARAGLIKDFTGVSAPYEAPLRPEVDLKTDRLSVDECVAAIVAKLGLPAGA
jgi:adenylyl-sulfate kinase